MGVMLYHVEVYASSVTPICTDAADVPSLEQYAQQVYWENPSSKESGGEEVGNADRVEQYKDSE